MPRGCSICQHLQRPVIDVAFVAGEALRNIRQRFGTSTTALHRHKQAHLRGGEARSQELQPPEASHQEPLTATCAPEDVRGADAATAVPQAQREDLRAYYTAVRLGRAQA